MDWGGFPTGSCSYVAIRLFIHPGYSSVAREFVEVDAFLGVGVNCLVEEAQADKNMKRIIQMSQVTRFIFHLLLSKHQATICHYRKKRLKFCDWLAQLKCQQ
jgi:hypothetical protein